MTRTLGQSPWLVVFDLDGTLIDSSLDLCLAVNAAMSFVGSPELPHERITSFIGDGPAALIRRSLATPLRDDQKRFKLAFDFFLEFYREHKLDNTRLYPGVLPALEAIRERHPKLPMAVLTNKPVRPSFEICNALGIGQFFFANRGGDSFETKKPNPTGLLRLVGEAKALWEERRLDPVDFDLAGVVMVGDSDTDVITARRAGIKSLGCRYGLSPHSLETAKPDFCCDHPEEWPTILG